MADTPIKQLRQSVERTKVKRRQLAPLWRENLDTVRGKVTDEDADTTRSPVAIGWTQTKAKAAQLFSQVPEVRCTPKRPDVAPAAPVVAALINSTLREANVATAMDEAVVDCIAASGFGAAIVAYESTTEMVDVPAIDPATLPPDAQLAIAAGQAELPTVQVPRPVDGRFTIKRISPSDFLWDTSFAGSDFDQSAWLGRSGRMPRAEAQTTFNLSDADLDRIARGDDRGYDEKLVDDASQRESGDDLVPFDEVFYRRKAFDPTEKYFHAIQRVVFIPGIETPVVDEPWKGQQPAPEAPGGYIGACHFPIRVLTLSRIPDEPIPPSDVAISRPQVKELEDSRKDQRDQRRHSLPIRWADINRVDPVVLDRINAGEWQDIIPVEGNGDNAIGEVSRAAYPAERTHFDAQLRAEIQEAWAAGPNQSGTFASGERSASEAQIVQANQNTRLSYERAKTAAFFCGIANTLAGLISLYGDTSALSPDDQQRLTVMAQVPMSVGFLFTIRPDSTVILDASQQIERLNVFLNLTAKSGFVNPEPVIREIALLSGLDPDKVMVKPQPPKPEGLNISIRSREDVQDPVMLALLMSTGQAPGPTELQAAKALLQAAYGTSVPQQVAPGGPIQEPASMDAPPMPPPVPPGAADMSSLPPPSAGTPAIGDAFPEWQPMPRLNRRRDASGDVGEGA